MKNIGGTNAHRCLGGAVKQVCMSCKELAREKLVSSQKKFKQARWGSYLVCFALVAKRANLVFCVYDFNGMKSDSVRLHVSPRYVKLDVDSAHLVYQ